MLLIALPNLARMLVFRRVNSPDPDTFDKDRDHCAAKGGRQKGIGKKVTQNDKKTLQRSDRKREKGYQKVEKVSGLPPFAYPLLRQVDAIQLPFLSLLLQKHVSSLESMRSGGAIPPPLKRGISAILARYPMKTRQMAAIPPSAILSRKGIASDMGGYLALGR